MQEFNCLDPINSITGHHFLEASAGTGKTFAIEHIVLRLICESGYSLSEILAVTFTKAATRDLRTRISATIRKALKLLREGEKHPFLHVDHILVLEEALASLSDLQVFTLHGFCYQALSKNALEIGFPIHASSPDEMTHTMHVIQTIRDFFRTRITYPAFSGIQISLLLKKYSLQALEKKLLPLVTGSVSLPEGIHYEVYEESVRNILREYRQQLREDVLTLAPFYKGLCARDGTLKQEFAKQLDFLEKGEDIEKTLTWKKLVFEFFTEENEKKKGPPYRSEAISRCLQNWVPLFEEMTSTNAIFSTLSFELRKYVQDVLGKHEIITPDGILELMRDATEDIRFVARVRKQYRAVIIDEFQDTDPIQWEIFQNLFFNDSFSVPTFYLVGDPKQSIYSFRNADIYTYLKARDTFSQLRSLSTNYRSAAEVINGLNGLFMHQRVAKLPVEYAEVQTGGSHRSIPDGKKGVHFFHGEGVITYIANEIVSLRENGLNYASCAVLVRDRFEAEKVRTRLLEAGIPSVMRHQGLLTDSPVFSLAKYILAVARDPFSMNEVKLLATHELIGLTAETLRSDQWQEVVAQLQQLHVLFKEKGVVKTIDSCMHFIFNGRSPLERIVEGMQLELWGDYLQLMTLLSTGTTIEAIDRLGKKGDDRVVRRPIQKENAVTIMTMHLSKGLEFDVVFALGVASRFLPKDPLLRSGTKMVRNEEGEECKAALHEMQMEKLRQLYVALTRAKRRIYIPVIEQIPPENEYERSPIEIFLNGAFEEILTDLGEKVSYEKIEETKIRMAPQEVVSSGDVCYIDTSSVLRETALSFSALSRPYVAQVPIREGNELPPGSETGTFFHEIYERIIEEALYFPYDDEKILDLITRKAEYTRLEAFIPKICEMVHSSFFSLLSCGARLVDIPPEQLLPEIEFYYREHSRVYKGVIDLLFCHESTWYVLDWKTTMLTDYSQPGMEQGMREHDYLLQAKMYATAAKGFVGDDFGGVYYLFLRGMNGSNGVYHCEA